MAGTLCHVDYVSKLPGLLGQSTSLGNYVGHVISARIIIAWLQTLD
jgi:hypothetical protein